MVDDGAAPGLENEFVSVVDGFDDLPGTGPSFVVDTITLASAGEGFDLDGACTPAGCIDNQVGDVGDLPNAQIAQGLESGQSILLMELAGLEDPYQGNERSMTLKIYGGSDADQPPNSTNNFEVPAGEADCCTFQITPQSLIGTPPQATARAPARIDRGRLQSLAPVTIQFVLTIGAPPHPELRIAQTHVKAVVPSDLRRITSGVLGGAVPIRTMANIQNPYCSASFSTNCPRSVPNDSKLIDLVTIFAGPKPDIDLDGDGLECLYLGAESVVSRCCDGEGSATCPPDPSACFEEVAAPVDGAPCTTSPAMADGYSVAFEFTAVSASVVGIAQ